MIAPLVLGFSTIGLSCFYFAWRYNVFFVTDTQIDTRGLIYPRAIKQLFVGLYIAELCMIGLFGASVAIGPLVLMVVFLVFTILFHISLNSALDPLLYNLPQSLLAEEAALRNDVEAAEGESKVAASPVAGAPKKSNIFTRFLKPWVFTDYYTLRQLVPQGQFLDAAQLYPGRRRAQRLLPAVRHLGGAAAVDPRRQGGRVEAGGPTHQQSHSHNRRGLRARRQEQHRLGPRDDAAARLGGEGALLRVISERLLILKDFVRWLSCS